MNAILRLVRRIKQCSNGNDGFTLVELLVASTLGIILASIVVSTLLASQHASTATTTSADLNGEARVLLNRLAGDLRQATPTWLTTKAPDGTSVTAETPAITNVQNPEPGGTPGALTSITFNADFDGDECVQGNVSDACPTPPAFQADSPETETFCWDPATALVYLISGGVQPGTCQPSTSGVTAQPLLSGDVTDVEIECDSSDYLFDGKDGSIPNGVTTWQEVDKAGAPVGNGNGVLDGHEFDYINSVTIVMTVKEGIHSQTYRTLVSLRNAS